MCYEALMEVNKIDSQSLYVISHHSDQKNNYTKMLCTISAANKSTTN